MFVSPSGVDSVMGGLMFVSPSGVDSVMRGLMFVSPSGVDSPFVGHTIWYLPHEASDNNATKC